MENLKLYGDLKQLNLKTTTIKQTYKNKVKKKILFQIIFTFFIFLFAVLVTKPFIIVNSLYSLISAFLITNITLSLITIIKNKAKYLEETMTNDKILKDVSYELNKELSNNKQNLEKNSITLDNLKNTNDIFTKNDLDCVRQEKILTSESILTDEEILNYDLKSKENIEIPKKKIKELDFK